MRPINKQVECVEQLGLSESLNFLVEKMFVILHTGARPFNCLASGNWLVQLLLLFGLVSISFTTSAASGTIEEFIGGLKRGHVNLEALTALKTLDASDDRLGYGLCMVAKRQGCAADGSFGYGLCMAAGRNGCVTDGSLGYGLCMAGKRSGCETTADLGYGLCMAANRTGCEEKF
jgi:hypothetical protein